VSVKANKSLTAAKTLRITLSALDAPSGTKMVRTVGLGTLLAN
jgi:hypothetical protein